MKHGEVKELIRPWMAQWGYVPIDGTANSYDHNLPKGWHKKTTGLQLDDLYYCRKYSDYHFRGVSCPFQKKECEPVPHHIILEYKSSKMYAGAIQQAIGQAIIYQVIIGLPTYLVVDREDLEFFCNIYRILPFGMITYSGEVITIEHRANLNKFAYMITHATKEDE